MIDRLIVFIVLLVMKNPKTIDWSQYWNPMIYVDNKKVDGDPNETIGRTVVYDVGTWQAFFVERRRLKGTFLEKLELFNFPFDTQVRFVLMVYYLHHHHHHIIIRIC